MDKVRIYGAWLFRVIYISFHRFYWENGFTRAAALAYTTLFSLLPLTVFAFGILASFVFTDGAETIRTFIFKQFIPTDAGVDTILNYLNQFSTQLHDSVKLSGSNITQSLVVFSFLVISCLLLLNSIESALNETWQEHEPRTLAQRIAILCTLVVLIPIFILSAFYANTSIQTFFSAGEPSAFNSNLVAFAINFLSFSLIYFLVPKAFVKFKNAAVAAFIAAILFELAKSGFAYYVSEYSSYNRIYGTISTILLFLLWLYVSWTIVLFGAEVSFQAQTLPLTGSMVRRKLTSIGDGAFTLGVQCLIYIGDAYTKALPLPKESMLAEMLGCSTVVLKPILYSLKRAQIIGVTEVGEITLLRTPDKILMHEVEDALYPYEDQKVIFKNKLKIAFGDEVSLSEIIS